MKKSQTKKDGAKPVTIKAQVDNAVKLSPNVVAYLRMSREQAPE